MVPGVGRALVTLRADQSGSASARRLEIWPAGPFASLARFAHEDNEEIEAVARGADTAVRSWADEVAEGGQELEEDGGRVGFCVWGEAGNDATRDTVESRGG
jgi:hypothetical protein